MLFCVYHGNISVELLTVLCNLIGNYWCSWYCQRDAVVMTKLGRTFSGIHHVPSPTGMGPSTSEFLGSLNMLISLIWSDQIWHSNTSRRGAVYLGSNFPSSLREQGHAHNSFLSRNTHLQHNQWNCQSWRRFQWIDFHVLSRDLQCIGIA